MHHKHRTQFIVVIASSFAFLVTVPMATTGYIQHKTAEYSVMQNQYERALNNRENARQLVRDYWQAMDVYRSLLQKGVENLKKPDMTDPVSIQQYLQENYINSLEMHGAAPDEEIIVNAEFSSLFEQERNLINGYIEHVGFCPQSLKRHHIAGMLDLCEKKLKIRKDNLQRALFDRDDFLRGFIPVQEPDSETIKKRLEQVGDSLDRSKIYDGNHRPHLKRVIRRNR